MKHNVTLRPARREDEEFLNRLYASTRTEELAPMPWSEAQKRAFLEMQFQAQHQYYHEHYRDANFDIIELDEQPIGRLYVARWEDEIRLMDIALLPKYRNQGIGTSLMSGLLDEAAQAGKPVRIHVEPFNPALRLYQRLGFTKLEERGLYWFMEWSPSAADAD